MSVALAVCGAIVLMAGAAAVLVGEVRRVEPAGGWQSLVSLGVVLIAGGFGLGVVFAVVTSTGLRGGGRAASRDSLLAGPEPAVAPSGPAPADWADEQGRPEGFVWAGDPAPPTQPAGRADWNEPDGAPRVAASGGENTKAEDWLSHLRGSGLGPVQQARHAGPPEAAEYADEGWQLDGSEWGQAPEVHHPTAGRRHDTGQWRAFGLDKEPPASP
ncbi:MAG TPA: hypothetical protein VHU92_08955 [Streptosporangiaceae bacterium]|nr:hypothetical protein [Streptosporangiaceae bacterium]